MALVVIDERYKTKRTSHMWETAEAIWIDSAFMVAEGAEEPDTKDAL